jgi:excinuclease UvrABC ATPase subunit
VSALRWTRLGEFLRSETHCRFSRFVAPAGAIKGWDQRNQFFFQMLQCLAQHYAFDLDAPFSGVARRSEACSTRRFRQEKIRFTYAGERSNKIGASMRSKA